MADEQSNQSGVPSSAQNKLESSKTHARRAAEDLKSAATTMAEDYRDKATQAWGDAKVRVRTLQADGEDYVRDNLMKSVITGLVLGLDLGLIVRRYIFILARDIA